MATFAVSAALFVSAYLACGLWDQTRPRRMTVLVWLVRFILERPQKGERPFFLGRPIRLPALYLHAGFLARDIARGWSGGR